METVKLKKKNRIIHLSATFTLGNGILTFSRAGVTSLIARSYENGNLFHEFFDIVKDNRRTRSVSVKVKEGVTFE